MDRKASFISRGHAPLKIAGGPAMAAVVVSGGTSKPRYLVFLVTSDSSVVALRFGSFTRPERNPAMAAGVTDHVWEIGEIVDLLG